MKSSNGTKKLSTDTKNEKSLRLFHDLKQCTLIFDTGGCLLVSLSIDKGDKPFDKFICHIGDFSFIVYSK